MRDWFGDAYDQFIKDTVDSTGVGEKDVIILYNYLCNVGLIDYDIEKEYMYDTYVQGDDDNE